MEPEIELIVKIWASVTCVVDRVRMRVEYRPSRPVVLVLSVGTDCDIIKSQVT